MAQKVLEALDFTSFDSDELSALAVLDSWFEKIDTAAILSEEEVEEYENIPTRTAQDLQMSCKQHDVGDFPQTDEKYILLLEQELYYANAYVEDVTAAIVELNKEYEQIKHVHSQLEKEATTSADIFKSSVEKSCLLWENIVSNLKEFYEIVNNISSSYNHQMKMEIFYNFLDNYIDALNGFNNGAAEYGDIIKEAISCEHKDDNQCSDRNSCKACFFQVTDDTLHKISGLKRRLKYLYYEKVWNTAEDETKKAMMEDANFSWNRDATNCSEMSALWNDKCKSLGQEMLEVCERMADIHVQEKIILPHYEIRKPYITFILENSNYVIEILQEQKSLGYIILVLTEIWKADNSNIKTLVENCNKMVEQDSKNIMGRIVALHSAVDKMESHKNSGFKNNNLLKAISEISSKYCESHHHSQWKLDKTIDMYSKKLENSLERQNESFKVDVKNLTLLENSLVDLNGKLYSGTSMIEDLHNVSNVITNVLEALTNRKESFEIQMNTNPLANSKRLLWIDFLMQPEVFINKMEKLKQQVLNLLTSSEYD